MALTAEEQKILDFALAAMPSWFTSDERAQEFMGAAAKLMGAGKLQAVHWLGQTLILDAVGPVGNEPDWLEQHAQDRGTSRQDGETDATLRARLRAVPDALTLPTILSGIQDIMDAAGVPSPIVAIVELPKDGAFFRDSVSDTGTGGEFFGTPPAMEFAPTIPFKVGGGGGGGSILRPVIVNGDITFAGSLSAGNDGTFAVTGLNGALAQFSNASGVVEVDGVTTWTQVKKDEAGNVLDGFKDSYLSRGFRLSQARPARILVILPFGSTTGDAAAVEEYLRQKKGAGFAAVVERRTSP